MPSVDTNVLLRWLLADVAEQAARVDRLLASGERFRVDDAALIETVFVLERVTKLTRGLVIDAIRTLMSTAALDLDRERWGEAISLYAQYPKLSIADVYLAVRAREAGDTPLYTFDRKLATQLDVAELV